MKTLVVTDLHLLEEELPYTKGGVLNSEVMLDELIRVVSLDKEIGLIVMLGDLTHGQPLKSTSKMLYENKFSKLKRIVNSRHERMPDIMMKSRDNTERPLRNRLVSLKGNWDFKGDTSGEGTYFDSLVDRGLIENPKSLTFKDGGKKYYYQFKNYGEGDKKVCIYGDYDKKVAFTHDYFEGEVFPRSYKEFDDGSHKRHDIAKAVKGIDDFIIGHMHTRFGRLTYQGTNIYIPGTNARTPKADSTYRDVGYNLMIDTKDYQIKDINIILKPAEEYFK